MNLLKILQIGLTKLGDSKHFALGDGVMRNQNILSHRHLIQRFERLTWQGFSGFALLRFKCKTFSQLFVEFGDMPSDRFRKRLSARTGKQ